MQIAFQLTELFQIEIDVVIYTDQFTCYIGTGSGQLGPKTSRPRTTRPRKKSAQDNSAQVVPISEDNSAQIAPIFEDLSAHENQTPLNVLKMTRSKIEEICPLTIKNQTPIISMHTMIYVKN